MPDTGIPAILPCRKERTVPITVNCPTCRSPISVREEYAGQTIGCPKCRCAVAVPLPVVIPPPAPAPPGDFERIDEGPSRSRWTRPPQIQFPLVFHFAAWAIIATCFAICSGCVSVKVHDTVIRPLPY